MNKNRLKTKESVHEEPMPSMADFFVMKTPMEILKPVLEKQAPFELDPFPGLRSSVGQPFKGSSLDDVPSDGTM